MDIKPTKIERIRQYARSGGPIMTKQEPKGSCDINDLVARAIQSGGIIPDSRAKYGDFTGAADFQDAMNRILSAQQDFMLLPSQLRARFNNDPGALLDFLAQPDNAAESIELGLREFKPAESPATPAESTPTPTSSPTPTPSAEAAPEPPQPT